MAKGKRISEPVKGFVCLDCAREIHGLEPTMGMELSVQICNDCGVPGACMHIGLAK